MSIENGIFGSTAPRRSAMSNRWLLRPKRVARNEMDSGFQNGMSKFKPAMFNRKVKLKNRKEN